MTPRRSVVLVLLAAACASLAGCAPKGELSGREYRGQVVLKVRPADTEVFLDGKKLGQAGEFETRPFQIGEGRHLLTLRRPGFFDERAELEPEDRQILVKRDLRKKLTFGNEPRLAPAPPGL